MEVLGYTILYLMNPSADQIPWGKMPQNHLEEILKSKNKYLKIQGRDDFF